MDPVEPNDRTSADRLAEFVVHLTDCDPQRAIDLIDLTDLADERCDEVDKLEVVARAMVRLRRAARPRPSIDLREQETAPSKTVLD